MSAVRESGGTPARRDVPEAGHDAVWMIASPHARWASASGDVQALSVASDEVCCTLHGAPAVRRPAAPRPPQQQFRRR